MSVYDRRVRVVYDALDAGNAKAAAKAAATALAKHPGDAQLTALRAVAVQRLGHGDEAVKLALSVFTCKPFDTHAANVATSALAAAGRRADALTAWRAAADAAPADADTAAAWFDAAAGGLDYGALAPAAARVARLDGSGARAWWPAAATVVQAVAAPASSPMGRAGLLKLATAMVGKLEAGGGELTEQQAALVACVRAEVEGTPPPPPPPPAPGPGRPHTALLQALEAGRTDAAAAAAAVTAYIAACGGEPYAAPSTVDALAPPLSTTVSAAVADAARTAAGDDAARVATAEAVAAAVGRGSDAADLLARVPPARSPADPPVAIAVQACGALVTGWRQAGKADAATPLVAALLLTDAAATLDPRAPAPRLAGAALAGCLGDAAAVHAHCIALALKHVLLDTVAAHLVLPGLLSSGDARTAHRVTAAVLAFHASATAEVGRSLADAFEAGSYGVAVELARFAAALRASRAHAAAATAAAGARVEGAAGDGLVEFKAACRGAVSDLVKAGWKGLVCGDDDDTAPPTPAATAPPTPPTFTWTDDLATRPHWHPPAACDDGVAVAAWWGAHGDAPAASTAWWCRHGAAADAGLAPAAEWRAACTTALSQRASLPWLAAGVVDGRDVRRAVAKVWGDGRGATITPTTALHELPGIVSATWWQAAATTTAAVKDAASADAAATALAAAAAAITAAADAIAACLAQRDAGLLTHGAWAPALALARTASVAAACAAAWKGHGHDALGHAIAGYLSSVRTAMERLAAAAAKSEGDVVASVVAALAADHAPVINWVAAAGLDVKKRVQGLVTAQASVLGAVTAAARAGATVAGRKV